MGTHPGCYGTVQRAAMGFDVTVMVVVFIVNVALLLSLMYKMITYTDLGADHINPRDYCKKVNRLVFWELGMHGLIMFLLLVSGHWVLFLLNCPYMGFNVNLIRLNQHQAKPEKVFIPEPRKWEERKVIGGLVFCMVGFFLYLYSMVVALVSE